MIVLVCVVSGLRRFSAMNSTDAVLPRQVHKVRVDVAKGASPGASGSMNVVEQELFVARVHSCPCGRELGWFMGLGDCIANGWHQSVDAAVAHREHAERREDAADTTRNKNDQGSLQRLQAHRSAA
jgi:hypothetical protein